MSEKMQEFMDWMKWPTMKTWAAYVRVSDDDQGMLHSLKAQIDYYTEYIHNKPGWVFGGVFIDEAYTGTKGERPGFQRLMEACRRGEVQGIITKSISRMARNTVLLHATVRELREMDVDVYFEENAIHTISHEGDFLLSVLSALADEESRIVSKNTKWRIRKDFEEGIPNNNTILGYRLQAVDGHKEYVVVPNEALIIEFIFTCFLGGAGCIQIARTLNELGLKTRLNNEWGESSVRRILQNEKRTGKLVLQKTFVSDHINKTKMTNQGELAIYTVPNAHEAIIPPEVYEKAQDELRSRCDRFHPHREKPPRYPFSGMICCVKCGKNYRRKLNGTAKIPVWICSTYNKHGKIACDAQQIPESILVEKVKEVLQLPDFNETALKSKVEKVRACAHGLLLFYMKNGKTVEIHWENKSRSESWTPEMRQCAREKRIKRSEDYAKA